MVTNELIFLNDKVKTYDRDRYITAMFSAINDRKFIFALYAFNIDISRIWETVEEIQIRHIRLQWWYDTLLELERGNNTATGHPLVESLQELSENKNLSFKHFFTLLNTKRYDLDHSSFDSIDILIDYCINSSFPLSLLLLEIFEINGEEESDLVKNLSISWALTGTIRSIIKSSSVGRVLIPEELLEKYNISSRDILNENKKNILSEIVNEMVSISKGYLSQCTNIIDALPKQTLPLSLQFIIVKEYLTTIERSNFNLYDKRVILMKPNILKLVISAFKKKYFN